MKLIHPYLPGSRESEQRETLAFLEQLKDNTNYTIEHIKTIDELDYETAIKYHWNQGEPFIILEQDNVPTLEILDSIRNCSEPICAANYILNMKDRKNVVSQYMSNRIITAGNATLIKAIKYVTNEEYADLYGFGLVKITPFGRYPFMPSNWRDMDSRLSIYTSKYGYKAHIHGTIKHNHAK